MKIKELPIVLEDPKTQVYLPLATTQTKGIASFDAKDFNVDPKGKVALNENLHQIKENTDTALENSQEAKETAEDALEQVIIGEGTKVYVNEVLQSSINVDSDIQGQFDQLDNSLSNLTEDVEDIQELVPNQAGAQNQLADKNFVNSSINAIAAFYITYDSQGNPFPTKAALSSATTFYSGGEVRVPIKNDYCLVLADETHDNASCRYGYSGEYPNGQWDFQFVVNETPFTSEQVAAINSGITSSLVQQITNNKNAIATKADANNVYTKTETDDLLNNKVDKNSLYAHYISGYGGAGSVCFTTFDNNPTITINNVMDLYNYLAPWINIYLPCSGSVYISSQFSANPVCAIRRANGSFYFRGKATDGSYNTSDMPYDITSSGAIFNTISVYNQKLI